LRIDKKRLGFAKLSEGKGICAVSTLRQGQEEESAGIAIIQGYRLRVRPFYLF
jgi:hypothetical protein